MSTLNDVTALAHQADLEAEAKPFGEAQSLKVEVKDLLPPGAALTPAALAQLEQARGEQAAAADPADEEVTLDFFGEDLPFRTFALRHPFRWNGEPVKEVEVHQLTTADLGRASAAGQTGDNYDIYAFMVRVKGTGTLLPARVLRKLPVLDGLPITDACWDFLPQSSPATGG